MYTPENISSLNYSSSAHIRIEVKGILDIELTEYLCGLNISWRTDRNKTRISRLEGEIIDQTALIGVLNALYDMRYPIISVSLKH